MDFFAHILISALLFMGGDQWAWAIFFGMLPDFIPFGLNMIIGPFRNKKIANHRSWESMLDYYHQSQNQWVYTLYNYTHSLIIWGIVFVILFIIGQFRNFFPWAIFAWLLHIVIDIPTHTKQFFAPQFLTPLSKFCVNGRSWADRRILIPTYIAIFVGIILRILQYTL
jgi:hypothetical protein